MKFDPITIEYDPTLVNSKNTELVFITPCPSTRLILSDSIHVYPTTSYRVLVVETH